MEKYKEELNLDNTEKADPQDVAESKETAIKTILGQDSIDLDSLTDEELDKLLMQAVEMTGMNEKVEDIVKCMTLAGGDDESIKDALHVQTGIKLEEAAEILRDIRLNG